MRIDVKNKWLSEISINVAPHWREKGIGRGILSQAIKEFSFNRKKERFFLARVKQANIASLKLFSGVGFFKIFDYMDKEAGKVSVLGYPK